MSDHRAKATELSDRTSSIKRHLSGSASCRKLYSDDIFSILTRGRSKLHLAVLEALYIRKLDPELCVQKENVLSLQLLVSHLVKVWQVFPDVFKVFVYNFVAVCFWVFNTLIILTPMLKCWLFLSFILYIVMCFSNFEHSLYYPGEKGKKTFDRKEVSTELCGFASLHANNNNNNTGKIFTTLSWRIFARYYLRIKIITLSLSLCASVSLKAVKNNNYKYRAKEYG